MVEGDGPRGGAEVQPAIDFSGYVEELSTGFLGRASVFQAISRWLNDPGAPRVFIVTGEPGSGKSAIAARLVQLTGNAEAGSVGVPLTPGFLSAFHFCRYSDYRWIDPIVFAKSISTQLANRYPSFMDTLVTQSVERRASKDPPQRST